MSIQTRIASRLFVDLIQVLPVSLRFVLTPISESSSSWWFHGAQSGCCIAVTVGGITQTIGEAERRLAETLEFRAVNDVVAVLVDIEEGTSCPGDAETYLIDRQPKHGTLA